MNVLLKVKFVLAQLLVAVTVPTSIPFSHDAATVSTIVIVKSSRIGDALQVGVPSSTHPLNSNHVVVTLRTRGIG